MKKLVFISILAFFGVLSCTIKDNEIIDLINQMKKQNDDLLLQLGSVKKTTDSALVAVSRLNLNQSTTDTKIEILRLDLQKVLTQIASLNLQITNNTSNVTELKAKVNALQLKCAELVAQIELLTKLGQGFSLQVVVSPTNTGTVTISPAENSYKYGTEITITATPASNYSFKQWTGDTVVSTNPLKIKITKNIKITALFESTATGNNVKDIDGNTYNTVKVGNQTWMKENLNVTKYQNGDLIPNVIGNAEWAALKTGAYSRYNNNPDTKNELKNGLLYNGFAIQDTRNLCPVGWRVPKVSDFTILSTFLGGTEVAGAKLKETGDNTQWLILQNVGLSTNESQMTALPAGYRHGKSENDEGKFWGLTLFSAWGTIDNSPDGGIYYYALDGWNQKFVKTTDPWFKTAGVSIRCIKN